ncbi:Mu-like prophage major head subunit gpT family protein [Escherichia coli]|uniref:Mu-like prophage major head subunit gpT family protein n=1 Tax=Escherichia coli TaxID=562 RepID=UPI003980937A
MALFHADHKNIAPGGSPFPDWMRPGQMMRLQKEGDRALNIRPAFMLVPVALETVANQTIKSARVERGGCKRRCH